MAPDYEKISRAAILDLKKGEVIEYQRNGVTNYLHVDAVDVKRGRVSGHITEAPGVNALSIDELVENGIRVAKWDRSDPKST